MQTLIDKCKAGDAAAFAELTRRYQNMAFACAISRLGDYQLAEDAVQEAFIAAYYGIHSLSDPAAFPGWIRGIVCHQCHRILRSSPRSYAPLEYAENAPSAAGNPAAIVEATQERDIVLDAVMALPDNLREVVVLHYIHEHSHREIATFLDIPVATVNNRLHSARTRLKRRMTGLVTERLKEKKLKNEFASRIGEIIKVRGPIIDIRMDTEELPQLLDSLQVVDGDRVAVYQVAQRLGEGLFRCVASGPKDSPSVPLSDVTPSAALVRTGSDMMYEVSENDLARTVEVLTTQPKTPQIIETRIKVIDLFCPMVSGGSTGIFGLAGVGKAVVLGELIRRIAAHPGGNMLFGMGRRTERPLGQISIRDDAEFFGTVDKTGNLEIVHLVTDLASNPDFAATTNIFDSVLYCSVELVVQGIWPAIDPLISHSRALSPEIAGAEHCDVARRCRETLTRSREILTDPVFLRYLAHGAPKLAGQRATAHREAVMLKLSAEDRTLVTRARKLELFMGQPFFVAEPYTKRPGALVPRMDAVNACRDILDGKYDALSEEAFRQIGDISEAK